MPIVWCIVGLALGLAVNLLAKQWPVGDRRLHRPSATVQYVAPLLGAAAMFWLATQDTDPARLAISAAFVSVLLLLAALDVTQRVVPNVVVFPATAAAILIGPVSTWSAVAGALAGLALFGALYWLGRQLYGRPVLGMGDVKLAMLIGALLGLAYVGQALLLGMLLAGLVAAILLLTKRVDRRAALPYGTFLALAGLAFLLASTAG